MHHGDSLGAHLTHRLPRAARRWGAMATAAVLAMMATWAMPATLAVATPAPARIEALPFGNTLDLAKVRAVVRSAPSELIATITALGIDVQRVPTASPQRMANPLLAHLPPASPELLRQAEFHDTYEGRVVLRDSLCCDVPRDTILIRDTAPAWTLLHEFVQALLPPSPAVAAGVEVELGFATAFHRLSLYHGRLCDDPLRYLDPRWRRDLLAALDDVLPLLYERIRMGQSQEAIVEKVLAREINAASPYFNAARREQGQTYGQLMIDNAIDVFNTVHGAIVHAEQAAQHLLGALAEGSIELPAGSSLTPPEQRLFEARLREAQARLAPVRTEIDVLKRYYTQP